MNTAILSRIIGGETAPSHTWGWTVGLYRSNHFYCAGSIIASDLVVTAAHCIYSEILTLSKLTLIAGSNLLSDTDKQGQIRSVHEVFIHPQYDNRLTLNDIAIIRLSKPFNMSDSRLAAICLPNAVTAEENAISEDPKPGTNLVVVGWGVTESGSGIKSKTLQQVTVQAVASNSTDCTTSTGDMVNSTLTFCAGVAGGGKDSCQGDSGGPLMAFVTDHWELVGITSNGYGCALPGHSGIYTRVPYFIPFINTIMNQNQTLYSSLINLREKTGHGNENRNKQQMNKSKSIQSVYSNDTEPELSDIFLEKNRSISNQRLTTFKESKLLAKRIVLYLGAAIPSPDQRGLDAIQAPLAKRYPVNGEDTVCGLEAWLSIDENGLQIQFISDPSVTLYYPIRSLAYCASIRFAKRSHTGNKSSNDWRFVSLDAPEANHINNSQNPPLFAVTFRRTRQLPGDECHCFVTKTKHAALELVEACFRAYHRADPKQDCSKVPLYFKLNSNGSRIKEVNSGIYIASATGEEQKASYQISRHNSGFFYKTQKVPINCWLLSEHQKNVSHRITRDRSSNSRSNRSPHAPRRSAHAAPVGSSQQSMAARPKSLSTTKLTKQSSQTVTGPYTPVPGAKYVDRTKDNRSGRNTRTRVISKMSPVPEHVPLTHTHSYDSHMRSNPDNQTGNKLSKDMSRLISNNDHSKTPVKIHTRPKSVTVHNEQNNAKKKPIQHTHQDYEIMEEYYVIQPDNNYSNGPHKNHHHKHDEISKVAPPQHALTQQHQHHHHQHQHHQHQHHHHQQQQFPASTFIQEEISKSAFEQQIPSPVFMQQQFPASVFQHQQVPTPAFPQQQFSAPAFTQIELPAPTYTQQQVPTPAYPQQQQVPTPAYPQQQQAPTPAYPQQQQAPTPAFPQQQQQVPTPAFPQQPQAPTPAYPQQPQPAPTPAFGQPQPAPTPAFGQPQPAPTPAFGQPQPAPTPAFGQQQVSTQGFTQQQVAIPTYPQQEAPVRAFLSQNFPTSVFKPDEFSGLPFDTKLLPPGAFAFHTVQQFPQSNNNNNPSNTYWYYTM
ncbi:unnamed protein product [Adineta steineri]|uniref:Peptidase S1 domain-containing protein n=1 Tax=Adineta steineri TaxID=433720 RepID=A0A814B4G9_9BILA|nr:unnamed protein product [Adineta steineri]